MACIHPVTHRHFLLIHNNGHTAHRPVLWRHCYCAMAFLLLLSAWDATASDGAAFQESTPGLWLQNEGAGRAELLQTDISLSVTGMLVEGTITQTFRNSSNHWQEALYLFPLPHEAAVSGMDIIVGERHIKGEIRPREEAKKTYERAKKSGKRAALVEQQRPNLFSQRLANIAPGETVRIRLQIQQPVVYDGREFGLDFPMTHTPRYSPAKSADASMFGQRTSAESTSGESTSGESTSGESTSGESTSGENPAAQRYREVPESTPTGSPFVRAAKKKRYEMTVSITVPRTLSNRIIQSDSHDVTVEAAGESNIVRLSGSAFSDRDFRLRWRPVSGKQPQVSLFSEHYRDRNHGLLFIVPPDLDVTADVLPRELILLVDTSGSMAGVSIRQARKAVMEAIAQLASDDYFNVVQFNNRTARLFPASVEASDLNKRIAMGYVQSLQANGGTEMVPALLQVAQQNPVPDRLRQIVFITDGAVSNEQGLFSLIRDHLGSSRLFTVAIGSAPNDFFMQNAADIGGGFGVRISELNQVGEVMSTLFERMSKPVLKDVRLTNANGLDVLPAAPLDLYQGEPVMLAIRGRELPPLIHIEGRLPGSDAPWQQVLSVISDIQQPGVARFWARQRLAAVERLRLEGLPDESIREKALPVALDYQLLSNYTSLVAVDRTPIRAPGDRLDSNPVPNLLPAGNKMRLASFPQTATWAPVLQLAGLLMLLMLLMLLILLVALGKRHGRVGGNHA